MSAPLEDPQYVPEHPPVDGRIPSVVSKFGAATQVRWFQRFLKDLKPMPYDEWERYHIHSVEHPGSCCMSCDEDEELGYGSMRPDFCCCRSMKELTTT